MRKLVFLIPIFLFCFIMIAYGAEGFNLLGVDFPSIGTEDWLLDSDTVLYSRLPSKFDIEFYLSPAGSVDSFSYSPLEKNIYVEKISTSLSSIEFYPAKINNVAVPFILPAELVFQPMFGSPYVELRLPYHEPECYLVKPLIEKTLELNEITPPRISRFPSYYCFFEDERQIEDYPYALFKVDLDSSGALTDYEQLFSTRSDFSTKVSTALLYADFQPAMLRGREFPATLFVIVRFFDVVDYPTSLWPPAESSNPHLPFDYLRVETELFLDSIINPPIPVNIPRGEFKNPSVIPFADSLEVFVEIDTLGKIVSASHPDYLFTRFMNATEELVKDLRFTPAKDISGKKVNFEGILRLTFTNSKIIRIVGGWLPTEAQERP